MDGIVGRGAEPRPYPDTPGPLLYAPNVGDKVLVRTDDYGLRGEHWCTVVSRVGGGLGDNFDESLPYPKPPRSGVRVLIRALAGFGEPGNVPPLEGIVVEDALFWQPELLDVRTEPGDFPMIGSEVLVDCEAYTGKPGPVWCTVDAHARGSAAVYPVKVRIPDRGMGQFKLGEIQGERLAR